MLNRVLSNNSKFVCGFGHRPAASTTAALNKLTSTKLPCLDKAETFEEEVCAERQSLVSSRNVTEGSYQPASDDSSDNEALVLDLESQVEEQQHKNSSSDVLPIPNAVTRAPFPFFLVIWFVRLLLSVLNSVMALNRGSYPWNSGPAPQTSSAVFTIGSRKLVEWRHLAEGGYAYVSLVRDIATDEVFALKRMSCQTREAFDAAQREEQLPPHPNIVEYYGSKVEHGREFSRKMKDVALTSGRSKTVFLVLEYCDGGHLLDLLGRQSPSEATIIKIITDVAMALFHLHAQCPPVFHRDIKLENILFSNRGLYKLCDFGSVSLDIYDPRTMSRDEILQSGVAKGNLRAPEMVDLYQKKPINDKADIWMLGCILYALVFGEHPFQNASVLAISSARFRIPEHKDPASVSPKLLDLMCWTLAQNPDNRPSAEELLELLQLYDKLDSFPIPKAVAAARQQLLDDKEQEQAARNAPPLPFITNPQRDTVKANSRSNKGRQAKERQPVTRSQVRQKTPTATNIGETACQQDHGSPNFLELDPFTAACSPSRQGAIPSSTDGVAVSFAEWPSFPAADVGTVSHIVDTHTTPFESPEPTAFAFDVPIVLSPEESIFACQFESESVTETEAYHRKVSNPILPPSIGVPSIQPNENMNAHVNGQFSTDVWEITEPFPTLITKPSVD